MDAVRPWLFVGNGESALDWRLCLSKGITRFLRVGGPPPPVNRMRPGDATATTRSSVEDVKSIDIDDDEDADLLSILAACHAFIDSSKPDGEGWTGSAEKQPGKVLVYCSAGVSRSQAVVASYLMRDEGATLNAVLAELPEHASPNDNFLAQLSILERMGGRLDTDSKVFRAFRQNRIARRAMMYGYFDGDDLSDGDYGEVDVDEGKGARGDDGGIVYRCRKCRRVVATSSNAVEHEEGDAGARDGSPTGREPCHLYIEALTWMRAELDEGKLEGKLMCVGCDSRIGKYSWRGMQCVCKAWVVPAFMLQRAKVDAIVNVPHVEEAVEAARQGFAGRRGNAAGVERKLASFGLGES